MGNLTRGGGGDKMGLVKKKSSLNSFKVNSFRWLLILILLVSLGIGIFLYWQNSISWLVLVFWSLILVVIGLLFALGIRIAQRNGFIDGFKNGRNGVKKSGRKS